MARRMQESCKESARRLQRGCKEGCKECAKRVREDCKEGARKLQGGSPWGRLWDGGPPGCPCRPGPCWRRGRRHLAPGAPLARSVPGSPLRCPPGPGRVSPPCAPSASGRSVRGGARTASPGVLRAALHHLPPFARGGDGRGEPRREPGAPGMLPTCGAGEEGQPPRRGTSLKPFPSPPSERRVEMPEGLEVRC